MTNIIDIYFDSVGSTATAPSKLWQWSKGQVVRINGLDLPTVYQVHFSNNPTLGTAEPVAVSGNMVSIPDIYLTTGEPVYMFIWLSDETSAETIRKGTIYVAKRSQPSGEYDPTAEQQTVIDGLIGSINTAVDTAEGYANSAQTYSGNAATSATEALNAKDAAQGYAEQASQTAQGVEILVNRAEDAADDAETAKQDVEQLKQAVEGFADDAESAKTDAETARGEAQGFAQTASAKASEASQSASQASQSATTATAQAQTATAKATEANQSAETATAKASEASASAATATTKASEASASASTATTAKNDAVTAKNAAVTAKTGAETARTGAETAAQSVSASAAQIATNTSDIADLKEDLKNTFSTITNSATDPSLWEQGSINVTNGANANSSVRIRTGFLPSNIIGMFVQSGVLCGVLCWDSTNTYMGSWNGTTFSKTTATFYEGALNFAKLLGTYKIKLYVKNTAGTAIAVADSSNILFSTLTDGSLTKQYIPADAKKTGDAINAVRDSVIEVDSPFVKLTKSSDIFTVEEGYYATTGNKIALAGYILCSYVAEQDFQIYADAETIAGNPALFVSIYNNSIASGNNVACYKRSDGTLPTEANKATVYAGQILAISIYSPSASPADFGIYANYYTVTTLADGVLLNDSQIAQVANKFTNFAYGKKIAWFGDSISELKSLPHIAGNLMAADVYDCSIRGSTIGRTYSNYDTFSFYNLVTAVISGDFSAQFAQLDAYEQAQGREYPGIRENLVTLSTLDFDDIDYVVLLQGTNDFGITAVHAATGYATKVDEMKARMDDAISRFITAYPKLKFYIISPPFRATPTEDYYGDTLADYIGAEQEVAEKYAIAFYNLLINSRICDANKTTYMNSDGGVYVHPNDYGDAWLAELCAKFISVN